MTNMNVKGAVKEPMKVRHPKNVAKKRREGSKYRRAQVHRKDTEDGQGYHKVPAIGCKRTSKGKGETKIHGRSSLKVNATSEASVDVNEEKVGFDNTRRGRLFMPLSTVVNQEVRGGKSLCYYDEISHASSC